MKLTRICYRLSKQILSRSVKTALVVVFILAFINHDDYMFNSLITSECSMKIGLTCLVPYSVASRTGTTAKLEAVTLS
mgnify:CR=1 FL=1